jgi:D-alanine-D-alanine ligase
MDAIAEEYIDGRELTVSVLGNKRLVTFPVWEMFFRDLSAGAAPIATARVKWDLEYQKQLGIEVGPAKPLPQETTQRISRLAKRAFRILNLSGYARLDLRLDAEGRVFVIEVNATPDITYDEDFAASAEAAGLSYPQLLQRIVNLGLRYEPPWKGI